MTSFLRLCYICFCLEPQEEAQSDYEIQSLHGNSVKKTVPMLGKTRKVNKAVINKRHNNIEDLKFLIKEILHSDQIGVAEVLRSDRQLEEQDEIRDSSEAECNEKELEESSDTGFFDDAEDDGKEEEEWDKDDLSAEMFSESSAENKDLRELLHNSEHNNPHHICTTEPKVLNHFHATELKVCEDEDAVPFCPEKKEDIEWSEEDSDWSDEDAEKLTESIAYWNSLNNPLYFCAAGTEIKATTIKKGAKKVCFSKEVTIHLLEEWPSESRAARDGSCWMEMAIDRHRFQRRVELTGNIISPCLQTQHRAKVVE